MSFNSNFLPPSPPRSPGLGFHWGEAATVKDAVWYMWTCPLVLWEVLVFYRTTGGVEDPRPMGGAPGESPLESCRKYKKKSELGSEVVCWYVFAVSCVFLIQKTPLDENMIKTLTFRETKMSFFYDLQS